MKCELSLINEPKIINRLYTGAHSHVQFTLNEHVNEQPLHNIILIMTMDTFNQAVNGQPV